MRLPLALSLITLLSPLATSQDAAPTDTSAAYVAATERYPESPVGGAETVLVYFGASTCGWCQTAEFKDALDRAKVLLASRADAAGERFAAIGVAGDWDLDAGLRFIQDAGTFDEIVVGRNWFNTAMLAHLFRPGGREELQTGLPGVVVLRRTIDAGGASVVHTDPEYLVDLTGRDVVAWVEAGAPLE